MLPIGCYDSDLSGPEADAGLQQASARAYVGATRMDVHERLGPHLISKLDYIALTHDLLDRHDTVAASRKHRARHHFDAVCRTTQIQGGCPGPLRGDDTEFTTIVGGD